MHSLSAFIRIHKTELILLTTDFRSLQGTHGVLMTATHLLLVRTQYTGGPNSSILWRLMG